MSKSILLVGGAGFLGSALRRALKDDARFSVAYSSTRGNSADPQHLTIDLLDPASLRVVREFDVIVNLTGQVTDPMERCLSLNTTGIKNLIESLDCTRQFLVQISTTQVYGTTPAADESSPVWPESSYATAKAAAEALLRNSFPPTYSLILRLCNLYGPEQAKGLPWYLPDCIRRKREIVIHGNNGALKRHFLHVDDAACMIRDLIAREATGIVNVAGPEQYSIRELVALIGKILGQPLPVSYGSDPPTGNIDALSTEKLRSLVPVSIRFTLEQYFREQLL